MNKLFTLFSKSLGIESNTTSHSEKFIASIGTLFCIVCIYAMTSYFISPDNHPLFVASFGASAVLLFAIPHGPLSQPWPVVIGHLLSAIIGIGCYQLLGNNLVTAGLAVSVSVLLMYYLRCLHPPGGSTAFFTVTAGTEIHNLGFSLIWTVICANLLCLVLTAIVFNACFPSRRYPLYWFHQQTHPHKVNKTHISQEDISAALHQMNTFIDVTPHDLSCIIEHAIENAQHHHTSVKTIEAGKFYSNGLIGQHWQIYKVESLNRKFVKTCVVAGNQPEERQATWRVKDFKKVIGQEVIAKDQYWIKAAHANQLYIP